MAMQAQVDYGALSVDQIKERLVQGIPGCEDREVLVRMCALLEGRGEGTSVAAPHNEGTGAQEATETPSFKPPNRSSDGRRPMTVSVCILLHG